MILRYSAFLPPLWPVNLTSQILFPLATKNYGSHLPEMASLWQLKCYALWLQQTTVATDCKKASATSQMLWPLATTNYGCHWPQIAALWALKCYSLWPQQTVAVTDKEIDYKMPYYEKIVCKTSLGWKINAEAKPRWLFLFLVMLHTLFSHNITLRSLFFLACTLETKNLGNIKGQTGRVTLSSNSSTLVINQYKLFESVHYGSSSAC